MHVDKLFFQDQYQSMCQSVYCLSRFKIISISQHDYCDWRSGRGGPKKFFTLAEC